MPPPKPPPRVAAVFFALLAFVPALLTQEMTIETHVVRPKIVPASPERIRSLSLPEDLEVSVFAEGLGHPRMIAVSSSGDVYVTRREPGDLWLLRDADKDGRAEVKRPLLTRKDLHGIAIEGDAVYLVTINEMFVVRRNADGALGAPRPLETGLPDAGQHPNRTIRVGPDGKLYLSAGSSCNACKEANPEAATLLQFEKRGGPRHVFATGLRNTIGFDWHPVSGQLWGMDHGIDHLGDDDPKEELNKLEEGQSYGWPYAYADGKVYPPLEDPPGSTKEEWAAKARKPALLLTAHSAPMQLVFYRGDLLGERYRNGAFVTLHGSWNRQPPSGYEVVFISFDGAGEPTGIEPFLSGFLDTSGAAPTTFGRPCGLAVMPDGSLLVGDDANGVIYRIAPRAAGAS